MTASASPQVPEVTDCTHRPSHGPKLKHFLLLRRCHCPHYQRSCRSSLLPFIIYSFCGGASPSCMYFSYFMFLNQYSSSTEHDILLARLSRHVGQGTLSDRILFGCSNTVNTVGTLPPPQPPPAKASPLDAQHHLAKRRYPGAI